MPKRMMLDEEILRYAVLGGAILGGGGGGPRSGGIASGTIAVRYRAVELLDVMEIPDDRLILCASAVGAPTASDMCVVPRDHVRAIELFEENTGAKVEGIMTSENGGMSTVNGWIQAAVLGIPLIDAAGNGRAHPTAAMGSMGLNNVKGYVSTQAVVGGDAESGNYLECFFKGNIESTSKMVRQASIAAGGVVAVARNPVPAAFVKSNGALHAVSHAIDLGREFYRGLGVSPERALDAAVQFLNGTIIAEGTVNAVELSTKGGFDVGTLEIGEYEISFLNEYMTLERNGKRLATFPDLIATFDKVTGMPATSSEMRKGQELVLIVTSRDNLMLGSGMRDRRLLAEIESILSKNLLEYIS